MFFSKYFDILSPVNRKGTYRYIQLILHHSRPADVQQLTHLENVAAVFVINGAILKHLTDIRNHLRDVGILDSFHFT